MDSPLQRNSDSRLIDIIQNQQDPEPDSEVMGDSLKEEVNHILNTLTGREAKILKMYFGLDGEKTHTLEEIGVKFKLTRERVRQKKEKLNADPDAVYEVLHKGAERARSAAENTMSEVRDKMGLGE